MLPEGRVVRHVGQVLLRRGRGERHREDVDEVGGRLHQLERERLRVGRLDAGDVVAVDVGRHRRRGAGHLREPVAVRLHPDDRVLVVAGRADRADRVAQPLEAEDLVLGGDRTGRGRVPVDARAQVDRVGLAVRADPAVVLGGQFGREVGDRRVGLVDVGRRRVAEELAGERPLQRVARRVVGAGGVDVVDVAAAEQLQRAALDRRSAAVVARTGARGAASTGGKGDRRDGEDRKGGRCGATSPESHLIPSGSGVETTLPPG